MQSINESNEIKPILISLEQNNLKRIKSERAYIISIFTEEINKERIGTKFKPILSRTVAIKLGHLKDNGTLYYFLSQCKDSKKRYNSFSKCFFGALKIK